jgi:hypothetical protein
MPNEEISGSQCLLAIRWIDWLAGGFMFEFIILHHRVIILGLLCGLWFCLIAIIKCLVDLIRLQNLRLYGRYSLFGKKNEKQSKENKNGR